MNYIEKKQIEAVEAYKRRMREKYESATTWFEDKFTRGLGYHHPETGEFIGINIITKQFIKEFLDVYEERKNSENMRYFAIFILVTLDDERGTQTMIYRYTSDRYPMIRPLDNYVKQDLPVDAIYHGITSIQELTQHDYERIEHYDTITDHE